MKYFKHSILLFLLATATFSAAQSFSGHYTIGQSGTADYANFTAAIAAMQAGIDGPVTFAVEPGSYAESIRVVGIPGVSAANTITFTSVSGTNTDVIVTGGYYHATYGMTAVDRTPDL